MMGNCLTWILGSERQPYQQPLPLRVQWVYFKQAEEKLRSACKHDYSAPGIYHQYQREADKLISQTNILFRSLLFLKESFLFYG